MLKKLMVANRGEIAIRVARSAAEMGIATVAVFSEDDAASLHTRKTDEARALTGKGAAAYLDIAQIVRVAGEAGCDSVHPGYGFLSENADFAQACADAGLVFVGPSPATLGLFGDKAKARALAEETNVPVLRGTQAASLDEIETFFASLNGNAMMLKAIAGGGGRGMRVVREAGEIEQAYERCQSEAKTAFGNGAVYAEEFLAQAQHIEVQIVGDGTGAVTHLWDRECSLQRRRQKLIEIAPVTDVPDAMRAQLFDAACKLAAAAKYKGLGTVEFLVSGARFAFIEANARLQVEHTVTEEITGLDLVRLQLEIASGRTLAGFERPAPRGVSLQARINMETMLADGSAKPAGGTLSAYEPPSGRGIRVDGYGYAGYPTNVRFDSLLAKLVVHAASLAEAKSKAYRALCEFKVAGVATNIAFLQSLLLHPAHETHTSFIDENIEALLKGDHRRLYVEPGRGAKQAGTRLETNDPLAVLNHGKTAGESIELPDEMDAPEGTVALRAPLQGTIVSLSVKPGDAVRQGEPVLIMEAMKMEHVIEADRGGVLAEFAVAAGDTVFEGATLAFIAEADVAGGAAAASVTFDPDAIRPDLAELQRRRDFTQDANRPEAVARRRKTGQRTVRENIEDLCDPDSFTEYAFAQVVAGRLRRNSMEELIARTPGDGLVMGLGRVNGDVFPDEQSRIVAMAYDYTVLAGTQGLRNHQKKDRILTIAEKWRLPIVFFTEGGGGRPGDTDAMSAGGLNTTTFLQFAKLSGLVPLVGINSGYCFAGNAALLGCCDVIIATKNSSIGMGGPAMIEGGGLGVFAPGEVGPVSVQAPNGVIDVVVEDEEEGVAVAKKYLSYFQGALPKWECADQRQLRGAILEWPAARS